MIEMVLIYKLLGNVNQTKTTRLCNKCLMIRIQNLEKIEK